MKRDPMTPPTKVERINDALATLSRRTNRLPKTVVEENIIFALVRIASILSEP